jgi:transposase-like protein
MQFLVFKCRHCGRMRLFEVEIPESKYGFYKCETCGRNIILEYDPETEAFSAPRMNVVLTNLVELKLHEVV